MCPGKIVIVEDETIIALDIRMQLQQMGYEVTGIAATGQDAIDLVAKTQPDMVMMDIRLRGEMDGIEAAQHIQTHFGDVAILFLTAYTDNTTLHKAIQSNPAGYLLKPFDTDQLRQAVVGTLKNH